MLSRELLALAVQLKTELHVEGTFIGGGNACEHESAARKRLFAEAALARQRGLTLEKQIVQRVCEEAAAELMGGG